MRHRASFRHGLPYGWWRSHDLWAVVVTLLVLIPLGTVLITAWWL